MILFKCGNCGYEKEVSEKYGGKRSRCPKCKMEVRVPSAGPEVGASGGSVIKFRCPSCNKKIGVGSEYAGKQVRCATCRNPLIVPGCSGPADGIGSGDDISVLRAGGERPAAGEEQWGGMESMEELRLAQESGPAVEKPNKLKPLLEEESQEQRSLGAELAARGVDISSMMKENNKGAYTNTHAIIIGVVVCGAFLFVVISWRLWLGDVASIMNEVDTGYSHVQEFVEECILLLAEGNVSGAEELFSDELYDSIKAGEVEEFSENVSNAATMGLHLTVSQINEGAEGNEYLMFYMIRQNDEISGEQGDVRIYASVWEIDGELMIDELALMDFLGNRTSIGHSNYSGMVTRLMKDIDFRGVSVKFPCIAWLVLDGLVLFFIVSVYTLFKKAGQPGWAIFVPFYNSWVLAEIGDRPGWIGLVANAIAFIPVVGWIIGLGLSVYISIGIAAAFGRGIVFGLGLSFLPFVFFPILAFASD